MKFFLVLCVFCLVISTVCGALAIYPADSKHPDGCFTEITGFMKHEEEKNLEKCLRASCNEDGSVQIASCGPVDKKCGVLEDTTKSYPDCCPEPLSC